MHVPTGLFFNFAAGDREYKDIIGDSSTFWFLQGGLERKWLSMAQRPSMPSMATTISSPSNSTTMLDADATRWGLGVVQRFDAAAMDFYAQATFWDFNVLGVDTEDMQTVMFGSRIKF